MLFGGAVTDRFSPRPVMLMANITRFFLTCAVAALVLTGTARLWMICGFALLFGVVAGFAVPAENSIVAKLVPHDDLQAGNSAMMGITQLTGFLGPALAGILIGHFSNSLTGVGIAFVVDAVTFVASAVALHLIRDDARGPVAAASAESVMSATLAGVRYLWTDKPLRLMFAALLLVNVLLIGPLTVGIPLLADHRLPEGAAAFGLLMSAFAVGNLAGYLIAGSLPRPGARQLRWIMIVLVAAFGAVISTLGFIPWTWLDFSLLLLLGLGNGFLAIILITWMQSRTPPAMLGRMMALLMLSSTGLVPLSQAAAGVLSNCSLTLLFLVPGALVLVVTIWQAGRPELKALGAVIATDQGGRSGSPITRLDGCVPHPEVADTASRWHRR